MSEKRFALSFLLVLFGISFIDFVSAQFYRGLTLSDLLNTFDPSTVTLTLIFIISFALIFWALSKFFTDSYGNVNKAIPAVVSFALSAMLVFEINRRGYDFAGFLYSLGFSETILYTIIPIALIIGLIFSGFRYGWGVTLTSFGAFFIVITIFTDIFYEKTTTFILGAILLIIGIWLWRRKKKDIGSDYSNYGRSYGPSPRQVYEQQRTQQRYQQKLAEQERQTRKAERRRGKKIAYDWEREKREARAIGRGVGAVGKGAKKTGKWIAGKYDWEKEKRQAKAIGKGAGWLGKRTVQTGKLAAKKAREIKKRRDQERELRRQKSKQKKVMDRYARRYGKGAARKRFGT